MKIKKISESRVYHILDQAKSILNTHKILKIEDVSDWAIHVSDWSRPELEMPISSLVTCSGFNSIREMYFFLKKLEKSGNNSKELILFNQLISFYSKKHNKIIKNDHIRRLETPISILSLTNENWVIFNFGILTVEELQRNNKLKYYPELVENEEIVEALKDFEKKGIFFYLNDKIESQLEKNWRLFHERQKVNKDIKFLDFEKELNEINKKIIIKKRINKIKCL